jgi:hypothetical protein
MRAAALNAAQRINDNEQICAESRRFIFHHNV